MMYSVKRISIRSVAKVVFILMLVLIVPVILLYSLTTPVMIFSEQSEPRFVAMITSLVVPIFYGILTAAFAAIVAFFYNVSVRLHGGIRLELEFLETPPPTKRKK